MISAKLGREYMAPPIEEHISGPGAGTYTVGAANPPGAPLWVGNAEEQISIALDQNGNGDQVDYVVKVEESGAESGYVQADGTVGASEVWRTAAQWTSRIVVTGLAPKNAPKAYRFAAKARNVEDTETAYSAWSEIMSAYVDLAYSPKSARPTYELTTGNCKISGLTITGTSKTVTLAYVLTRINTPATKNNVKIYYSTTGVEGSYVELTAPAIGGATTTLTASATGTTNTNTWLTCTTLGNSYNATVYMKVVPYDTATGGNPGTAATTTLSVDNRPVAITIAEISGLAWDADSTPDFTGVMGDVQCGTNLHFILRVYDSSGAEIHTYSSADRPGNWYYEQSVGSGASARDDFTGWTAMPATGVPVAYTPPTLTGTRVRFVLPDALTPGQTYGFDIQQAEYVHILV